MSRRRSSFFRFDSNTDCSHYALDMLFEDEKAFMKVIMKYAVVRKMQFN